MADNPQFFRDTREPHFLSPLTAVTLAATDKALYPKDNFPSLGEKYFSRPTKKLRLRFFGLITTAATPGNLVLKLYYGTGADANGIVIASTAAVALIANQANKNWMAEFYVRCITIGSAGTLAANGEAGFEPAVIASTNQPLMMPNTVSAAVDLTAALIISLQANRSGSTAETMTITDMEVESLN
jgi:hypothetical protein